MCRDVQRHPRPASCPPSKSRSAMSPFRGLTPTGCCLSCLADTFWNSFASCNGNPEILGWAVWVLNIWVRSLTFLKARCLKNGLYYVGFCLVAFWLLWPLREHTGCVWAFAKSRPWFEFPTTSILCAWNVDEISGPEAVDNIRIRRSLSNHCEQSLQTTHLCKSKLGGNYWDLRLWCGPLQSTLFRWVSTNVLGGRISPLLEVYSSVLQEMWKSKHAFCINSTDFKSISLIEGFRKFN